MIKLIFILAGKPVNYILEDKKMNNVQSQIKLVLGGDEIELNDIAFHSRTLLGMLEDALPESEVKQDSIPGPPGEKGDPISIGAIVIGLISSGAVKAIIECVRAILERDKHLIIEMELKDGNRIKIDSTNIKGEKVKTILEKLIDQE